MGTIYVAFVNYVFILLLFVMTMELLIYANTLSVTTNKLLDVCNTPRTGHNFFFFS
jgi:hypothetical protein